MTIQRRMVQLEQLFAGTSIAGSIDDTSSAVDKLWSAQKLSNSFSNLGSTYAQLNASVSFTAIAIGGSDLATILSNKSDTTHNHDGVYSPVAHTHAIADTAGLQQALDAKINMDKLGAASGVATLDASGFVPATQLPSFVDDVLEYTNQASFPATGAAGKIYVALDTNKTYRWSGSTYIEISASPGSTDGVTEGSVNLYFTNARAVSALTTTLGSYAAKAGATFTGKVNIKAADAAGSGINLGQGANPSAGNQVNGDIWITSSGLFYRANGTQQQAVTTGTLNGYANLSTGANFTGALQKGGVDVSLVTHNHDATYQAKSSILDALASLSIAGNPNLVIKVNATADGFVLAADQLGAGGGSGISDNDYGDVAVSGSGTVMTVQSAATGFTIGGTNVMTAIAAKLDTAGGGLTGLLNFGTLMGKAAPTLNTRSIGTRIVLQDSVDSTRADHAIGMDASTFWFSIPASTTAFKWYAGTAAIATLAGTGDLSIAGTITTTGATLTVGGTELVAAIGGKVNSSLLGQPNGVATLDGSGLIPSAQLPSFVDDVLEYVNFAGLPATGTTGKIYVTLDNNKTYRWSGSAYVEISASPGSTDSVTEGSVNLYFTQARVRTSPLTGLSTATGTAITATDTVLTAFGKVQAQLTNHIGSGAAAHAAAVANGANGFMTGTDKAKLDGVAAGATANSSDATLKDRSNHTGTQAISTVTNLQTSLDAKQNLITIGTTAPASPVVGQLWVDTN